MLLKTDSEIIESLGGTYAVARLCEIKPSSVSEWKVKGIPKARRQFLAVVNPELFKASTPKKRKAA